jgi:hypothetical protein
VLLKGPLLKGPCKPRLNQEQRNSRFFLSLAEMSLCLLLALPSRIYSARVMPGHKSNLCCQAQHHRRLLPHLRCSPSQLTQVISRATSHLQQPNSLHSPTYHEVVPLRLQTSLSLLYQALCRVASQQQAKNCRFPSLLCLVWESLRQVCLRSQRHQSFKATRLGHSIGENQIPSHKPTHHRRPKQCWEVLPQAQSRL